MQRHLIGLTLCCMLVMGSSAGFADAVHGPVLIVTDTPTDFRAIGSLTTVDDDNPVNGVTGPWLKVEKAANPNWSFEIRHLSGAPHYQNINGDWHFMNIGVSIRGGRANNIGHIATPHQGEAPNALPVVTTAARKRDNLEMGKRGRGRSARGALLHGGHTDMYAIEARVAALAGNPNPGNAAPGPPNLLTGSVEIVARHFDPVGGGSKSHGGSFYSNPGGGTWVSYNTRTGLLEFHIGEINGVDLQGGALEGVDDQFADDPILDGKWTVEPIKYLGEQEGVHQFRGGALSVKDSESRFEIAASFDRFVISDSSTFPILNSYGVLSSWEIDRISDECHASAFLEEFVRMNLLGYGLSQDEASRWRGIDLGLVTQKDIVEATNGFTKSVDKLWATVYLTLNLEPEGDDDPPQQAQQKEVDSSDEDEEEKSSSEKEEQKEKPGLAEQVTDFLERAFPGLRD